MGFPLKFERNQKSDYKEPLSTIRELTYMANLPYNPKKIFWVGDSKEELSSFPMLAKKRLGFALRQIQNGLTPELAKPLKGFGSGVYELRANAKGDTYRVVYLIKLKRAMYVVDAFQKKSKRGKQTPKEIAERLKKRIAEARKHEDECSNVDQTE
jgi:phage-related protein